MDDATAALARIESKLDRLLRDRRSPELISMRRAAEILAVSRTRTVAQLVARGDLQTVRCGSSLRLRRRDVLRLAESGWTLTDETPVRRRSAARSVDEQAAALLALKLH